jgi:hypothetical protein
LLSNVQQK